MALSQRVASVSSRSQGLSRPSSQYHCLHIKQARLLHTKIAIVGGGTGGMTTAGHILRKGLADPWEITVFEPSNIHYYQPGFTATSGGLYGGTLPEMNRNMPGKIYRPTECVFDSGVKIIKDKVGSFNPDSNELITMNTDQKYTYDHLIVAAGMELRFDLIEGAMEALLDPEHPAGSMYRFELAKKMSVLREQFTGGRMIATQAPMPIKCAGAPQKFVYLSEASFKDRCVRLGCDIHFHTALPGMFGVKKYSDALHAIALEKGITPHFESTLTKVDPSTQTAYFVQKDGSIAKESYDLLHIVPPMRSFKEIAEAPFSDASGFVAVNKHSLQSVGYPNVWSLGDCSSVPTSKTAAAIFSQAPILVSNLERAMKGEDIRELYDGYTSCPIFVGHGRLMLAEFGFDGKVDETFSFMEQSIPRAVFYQMKMKVFPSVYWNRAWKGQWFGRHGPSVPHGL